MANGCRLCPRRCEVDRTDSTGFCGAHNELEVSTICVHTGEEPPLNPIVNVFFTHCNLQCIYCQNYQISGKSDLSCLTKTASVNDVAERICALLPESGGLLGLVTASHYANHIPELLDAVRYRGYNPTVVYNSSGYESVETLQRLEGLVDIYLPDLKYMDPTLAKAYSHAPDYPEVATAALLEMKRQVGSGLKCDEEGSAFRGIIVRHLVLPGHTENSLECLEWLADHFPPTLHVSLMAQYFPPREGLPSPINRTLREEEYNVVANRYRALGFNGWLQELEAESNYRPDFTLQNKPFK